MVAEIPHIEVIEEEEIITENRNGIANKIALIGAFDTLETNPQMFISLTEAQEALGTDTSYNGCKILPIIFGSGGVLAVNITTETEGTRDKTLTTSKLTEALAKIKGEDFDMVFVADLLADEAIVIMNTFLTESMKMQFPAEYIFACNRANNAAYLTTAGKTGKYLSGMIIQAGVVNGVSYDALSLAAYYAKYVSELPVANTMTNRELPGLESISPEYTFEDGDDGKSLVGAGVTIFKVQNRETGKIVVVNSEQPDGLDLYVNRGRNYVIKELTVNPYLGSRNRKKTMEEIEHVLDAIKYRCINELDILKDIQYNIEKISPKCLEINQVKLVFDGIITTIRIKYRVEVE